MAKCIYTRTMDHATLALTIKYQKRIIAHKM